MGVFLSHLSLYFFAKFFFWPLWIVGFPSFSTWSSFAQKPLRRMFRSKIFLFVSIRRMSDMLKHASSDFWNFFNSCDKSSHTSYRWTVPPLRTLNWIWEARTLWCVPVCYPVALASSWSKQKVGCTIENPQSEGQEKTWTTSMKFWVVILLAAIKQEEVELHLPSVSYMGEWSKCLRLMIDMVQEQKDY